MPKLIVQLGGGRFREYELGRTNSIGRHPDQDIGVMDALVSKEHLVLELLAGEWFLRDLDSRNGTWLNGERVRGRVRIQNNDRVKIGTTHMVFINRDGSQRSDHTVTIGDSLESSIYGSLYRESAEEFLPVDLIPNEETLRRDYEKLRLASRLHREIAFDVRLDQLLPRILDHLFGLFKADRGVILLAEVGGQLTPRAVKVRGRAESSESISLSQTILNKVLAERAAVLTRDAQLDDRFHKAQSVIIQGIRSTMCVPLLSRTNSVIGVIHLDSLLVANAFTEKDLGMLQAVAQQAGIAIENSRLVEEIEREAVTRQKFEKMLSPNLVERVVKGELEIKKGGELRPVTVMFTDIRGFTELAEKQPPKEVVRMLNEYFELLVDIVFDFDGTLDKFIGDALMAIWGAPVEDANMAQKAVQCAVEMQRSLERFNTLRRLDGKMPIHTGIGIDMGECVLGYMGSSKTMSFTAVGPTVNLASRLCASARSGEILISETAYDASHNVVRAAKRKPLTLKGISNPVTAWSVVAAHYSPIPTEERPIDDFGPLPET
ncbi:MAG: FHA domain-containing protein [Myxococcales bacterium]|nr:FHA domain-containing protein [Myxococcales bacterium]MCB9733632.1 FHA domain-containing protein [Deltaproteobacteria bacterium]